MLITGAMRLAEPVDPAEPAAYNSIYVIDREGSIASLYDKVHLVPFGEYLPFQRFLERLGLQQLTKQRGGFFSRRSSPAHLRAGGAARASPHLLRDHLPGRT